MKLKNTLVSIFAATAITLSVAAPIATAQTDTDDAYARVTLVDDGTFDAYFQEDTTELGSIGVTAANGGTLDGALTIVYVDTHAHRGEFTTSIQAGDFNSSLPVPYNGDKSGNGAGNYYIGAENFRVVHTNNVSQGRWSGQGYDYRVGDIGAYGPNQVQNSFSDWSAAEGSLDQARRVNYAWQGSGTIWSASLINVELTVPAAMPGVDYQSVLTLTVSPGTP